MKRMAEILNSGLYNLEADTPTVKCIGMDTDTNELALYLTVIPIKDALSGFPKDRLLGRMKTQNQIKDIHGDLTGITVSEADVPAYEGSLVVAENSVFETNTKRTAGYRNVLDAMLLQETFYPSPTGKLVKPLGCGGNVMTASGAVQGRDWKWFFYKDNLLLKAYTGSESENIFLGAFNRSSQCSLLELNCVSNTEVESALKWTVLCGNNALSEASEKNTTDVNIKFLSDFRHANQTLEYGFGENGDDLANSVAETEIFKANVDYIIVGDTLDEPSDTGIDGEFALVINTGETTSADKGKMSLSKQVAGSWAPVLGTIGQGAVFFSNKVNTSTSTVADVVNGHTLVACKTAGVSGLAIASGTVVDPNNRYAEKAGNTKYTLPMYAFNFGDKQFNLVTGTSDL